ncbi:uncharacterized protein LOC136093398 [Hydra vulgaris]|uniref:uncharacterized protein LOC136093398 n=1 Tax=Hydra vulgaris TaxID=6087 RepID=UPI0032EA695F
MKLWTQKVYINEDYSDHTMELRKKLLNEAKDLRAKDDESDPDLNYFSNSGALQNKCNYFYTHEIKGFLDQNNINTIHINIRSLQKIFEIFRNFIEETCNLFNIICLTETWCSSDDVNFFTNFELPGFNVISLARKTNKRGGGVLIYVKNNLRYFTRHDMSISDADKEVLTIEILTNKIKNKILSCCYRPPLDEIKNFNSFSYHKLVPNEKQVFKKRFFTNENLKSFKEQLSLIDWSIINTSDDINLVYNSFFKSFYDIYETNFPEVNLNLKAKSIKSPWITKVYNKGNYWQQKCTSHSLPNTVKHNNEFLYDKRQITEEFNKYFVSVGPNLAKRIPIANGLMNDLRFPLNSYLNSFELSFEEFENAFKMLKSNKAVGPDAINGNIIISSFDVLKDILFKIFSISIKQGIFPHALKIAKVIPILKSGDIENISNYRPISLLSVFSKVLERILYNKIYSHLTLNNLLYSNQYGFQKNNSTEHAILQFTRNISDSFENSQFTLGVFIDLAKAFDTIDHEILFKKLEWYGITGKILIWLKSYLNNRKQFVYANDNVSSSL